MLKLFAIFLKAENPANTEYMREKYLNKMQTFIHKCEVPQELHELSKEKQKQLEKGKNWPQFKEDYYNKLGAELDTILKQVPKEKMHGFSFYMKWIDDFDKSSTQNKMLYNESANPIISSNSSECV